MQDRRKARDEYHRIRQQSGETISDFKARFDHILEMLRACGQQIPPDDDLAADFIGKLDNSRYGALKTMLDNNQMLGIGVFPPTLVEAYTVSSKFKVVSSKPSPPTTTSTAFVAQATSQSGKKQTTNKQPQGSKNTANQRNEQPKQTKQKQKQKKPFACNLCGEEGHMMRECSWLAECKAIIDEKKPGSKIETSAIHFTRNNDVDSVVLVNKLLDCGLKPFDVLLDNQATSHIFTGG